jgi:uncharacterized damage-inducible protein DinB
MATQQTISEKDLFVTRFEIEHQITRKVLRAYPADKAHLKPSESSQSAREVAWSLVQYEAELERIIQGQPMSTEMPPAPATWPELLAAFDNVHKNATTKVAKLTDETINGTVRTMTGPKQEGDVRKGDALWAMLNEIIHKRGQFSVYLRMAGGKVPSIYGPSGDEPW